MTSAPVENKQLVDSEKLSAWANSPEPSLQTLKFWMAQINMPCDFEVASNSQPCNGDIIVPPQGSESCPWHLYNSGYFWKINTVPLKGAKTFFLNRTTFLSSRFSHPQPRWGISCARLYEDAQSIHTANENPHTENPLKGHWRTLLIKFVSAEKKHPATARATPLRPSSHAGLCPSSAWREMSKQFFHWRFHVLQRITDSGQSDDNMLCRGHTCVQSVSVMKPRISLAV